MELTLEQALQQGIGAHKEGKLQDAERLYRAILQSQPSHPDANHNLGVLAVSVNQVEAALPLFKIALEANPKIEQFWLSYIDALIKEKQFEIAKAVLEQGRNQGVAGEKVEALEEHLTLITQAPKSTLPEQKKSPTLLEKRKKLAEQNKQKKAKKQNFKAISPSETGIKRLLEHYENGQYGDAEQLALSITERFPKHQFSWKILGSVLKQTGRINESLVVSQNSVQLQPQDAGAHSNLGSTLQELGRLDEAEASFRQAIALKPDLVEAHSNLGVTLRELGRLDEAEASLRRAIALKPDFAEAHSNLGSTLSELGRLDESEASYRQAIALKPDYAGAHSNLGNTLQELGRLDEAEASFRQAIALKPDLVLAHNNLGNTLKKLGRFDEAEASYTQAIALKPDYAGAHGNLGLTLQELGRFDEAHASYNTAIELKADLLDAYSNKNLCLNYSSLWSPLLIYKQHLEFEKQFGGLKIEPPLSLHLKKDFGERLRIGYVSADFRKHSVAYFFEPLLQHHSSHVVETFCYYNNTVVDATTKRIMATCDHWRSIFGIADPEVANLIRNDKIDILVDLSGHTEKNSLLVFAQKPAPIQVTWLGYPNTTGLSAIDYRFTDIIADPIGEADELHSETLLRLPNGFLCYQGNEKVHVGIELPQKSQGHITFGILPRLN